MYRLQFSLVIWSAHRTVEFATLREGFSQTPSTSTKPSCIRARDHPSAVFEITNTFFLKKRSQIGESEKGVQNVLVLKPFLGEEVRVLLRGSWSEVGRGPQLRR